MGCSPVDFQEVKRPLRTTWAKRPIKVGKRPINEGKRAIKAMALVRISVGCLMGCFRAPPPWRKTARLKRPIKRSMRFSFSGISALVAHVDRHNNETGLVGHSSDFWIGHTPKGSYSPTGRSKHLLEKENPSKNPFWDPFWETQETTKDPKVEGSRSDQSSVNSLCRGTKTPKTLCFTEFWCKQRGADDPWPISADCLNPWLPGLFSFSERNPFSLFVSPLQSEVSKRGRRTEGVGARKSLPDHKFKPFFCPLFPMPPYEYHPNGNGCYFNFSEIISATASVMCNK